MSIRIQQQIKLTAVACDKCKIIAVVFRMRTWAFQTIRNAILCSCLVLKTNFAQCDFIIVEKPTFSKLSTLKGLNFFDEIFSLDLCEEIFKKLAIVAAKFIPLF